MPSAATAKLEKQASTEAVEPIRQAIIIVEHKIRNLEKRKRKIESYQEEQKNGKNLNSDQLSAVAKFDEVVQSLDLARDLSKQFNLIAIDSAKAHKRQAKKEAAERTQQELVRVKEILIIQDVLQNMGQENVREDFLAGQNGAVQVTQDDLKFLDDLYTELTPKHGVEEGTPAFEEQMQQAAEHLISVVEGRAKDIVGTTYEKLKELLATINGSGYFQQPPKEVPVEELVEEVKEEEEEEEPELPPEPEQAPAAPAQEDFTPEQPDIDTVTFPQVAGLPLQGATIVQVPVQVPTVVPTPVAAVESSYFSTAAAAFIPSQPRPLNEFIGSAGIDFIQDSELDPAELSAMMTGGPGAPPQQRVQPTPPPSVAPIPTQTFTNQNFASVTTANIVPQPQLVYQAPTELPPTHIPGFVTAAVPNPAAPILVATAPIPPPTYSSQVAGPVPTYAAQAQQTPYSLQQQHIVQQQSYDNIVHQKIPEPVVEEQVPEPAPADDGNSEWCQNEVSQVDWAQQPEPQGDWNQASDNQGEWSTAVSSNSHNDGYTTQNHSRGYGGGRGRMNRGGNRGPSNGYSGPRGGGRGGNYQNGNGGRGGGGYGGYRNNNESGGGGNNYYQNGYTNSYGGGGYKRGGPRGGAPRGGAMDRGGQRGGPRGAPRGNRGNYVRGGANNKQ